MRFKDKIVLITGSAGGIGFKTALDFGNEGAIVAVTDIDFEMAKKLSNQIISNGGIAEPFQLDVTNLERCKSVFNEIKNKYDDIEICFFSTGTWYPRKEKEIDIEQINNVFDINFFGA